jgi:inner membrane protein
MIAERESRQGVVQDEFTRNWGPPQELRSPILVVPYQSAEDRPREYLKITPDRLSVVANLAPQERKRGLFHATVYDANVEMQGVFVIPSETRLKGVLPKDGRLLGNESFIAFATTSLTGLKSEDKIAIDGVETPWQPCAETVRFERDCKGVPLILASAPVAAAASKISFQLTISLRGTGAFNLTYAGKELDATIRSPWQTPSFGGNILPENSNVSSDGFEAHWQTTTFGSPPISPAGAIADPSLWKGATIGVELIEATPLYRTINRVAKYGLLFVVLSFAIYFFFELLSRLQIHLVQYALLGLSLSLFSLLLLSLSARRAGARVRRHASMSLRFHLCPDRPRNLFTPHRRAGAVRSRLGVDVSDVKGGLVSPAADFPQVMSTYPAAGRRAVLAAAQRFCDCERLARNIGQVAEAFGLTRIP